MHDIRIRNRGQSTEPLPIFSTATGPTNVEVGKTLRLRLTEGEVLIVGSGPQAHAIFEMLERSALYERRAGESTAGPGSAGPGGAGPGSAGPEGAGT